MHNPRWHHMGEWTDDGGRCKPQGNLFSDNVVGFSQVYQNERAMEHKMMYSTPVHDSKNSTCNKRHEEEEEWQLCTGKHWGQIGWFWISADANRWNSVEPLIEGWKAKVREQQNHKEVVCHHRLHRERSENGEGFIKLCPNNNMVITTLFPIKTSTSTHGYHFQLDRCTILE